MQVWKVTDCDWVAAGSFEEAAKEAIENGISRECIFEHNGPLQPLPLTEDELREMPICDHDDGPDGDNINGWDYLKRLEAACVSQERKAIFFASTEW